MPGRDEQKGYIEVLVEGTEEAIVGAREKLNEAYVIGSLLLAAIAGWISGSWLVFIIAAVILLALNLHAGDIRPSKRR